MRNSDMGGSDAQFHCRTHLGHLLAAGDTVIGYGCCCNVKGFLREGYTEIFLSRHFMKY